MAKSHTAKSKKQLKGSKEKRRVQITDLPGEGKNLTADEQKKVRGGFLALQEATQVKGDALALQEATQMESRKSRQ
jgi:hypothetical protein